MKRRFVSMVLAAIMVCLTAAMPVSAQEAGAQDKNATEESAAAEAGAQDTNKTEESAAAETGAQEANTSAETTAAGAADTAAAAVTAEAAKTETAAAEDPAAAALRACTGVWARDRITLYFDSQENSNFVVVTWPSSAAEVVQWVYRDVTYDDVSKSFTTLENGEKTGLVYDENGRVTKCEKIYSDGAAIFRINDEGKLVWTDCKEAPGENEQVLEKTEKVKTVPSVGDFTDKYFRVVGKADQNSMDAAAAATVRFAVDYETWGSGNDQLRENMKKAWESLTDEERTAFTKNYMTALGVVVSCIDDWDGHKEAMEKIGKAGDMEMAVYDGRSQLAWSNLFHYTYTMINPPAEYLDAARGADGLHASAQEVTDSPDWVKNLPSAKDEKVKQLFVVAGMGMDKTTATISMHKRDENGAWKQILSTPGYVGKNGLVLDKDRKEGCGQTPVGVYHFNKAFGIAPDPGCPIPYNRVTYDMYWSGDEKNHYNELVNIKDIPDLDLKNSEHLIEYEYEYQYGLNISFNEDGTAGRGSAIFLHCLGTKKPYTGGCVAIPENIMKLVMQNVDPDCVVIIDTLENLGGSL